MTERLTDEALLPCPFCGGVNLHHYDDVREPFVQCQDCDAFGPNGSIAAWNRRATPADDLRAALDKIDRLTEDLADAEATIRTMSRRVEETRQRREQSWQELRRKLDEARATLSQPAPAPQPADDLRAALQGMVDMWASVCRAHGHDPAHMAQYEGALAALSQNGGAT